MTEEHPRERPEAEGDSEGKRDRMRRIWAPWRIDYIVSDSGAGEECFFCEASGPEIDPKKHLRIWSGERVLVLLNRYPYNNGHLLIAPHRHRGNLSSLSGEERAALMETVERFTGLLEDAMHPDGFNVGMNLGEEAGAGMPDHLHVHIVPRWAGDTNFMPVTANTRVLPQSLEGLYELLVEELS